VLECGVATCIMGTWSVRHI